MLRLKKRADFVNCRHGVKVHTPVFTLQLVRRAEGALPSDEDNALRVGFTVTKKTGNAVMRNRIKRRLREAVRHAPLNPGLAGCDVVLIAREQAALEPFSGLVDAVSKTMESAVKKQQRPGKKH